METKSVKKIYDHYSPIYDFIFKGWFYPRIKYAINLLDIKPGDKILEVGIGTGLSMTTYPSYCEVIGIDLSKEMLKKAEKKRKKYNLKHISLKEMDASNLKFEDSSFDTVVAAFMITVVPDPCKVISEIKRVVKKSGKILIINHFLSENKILAFFEEILSPICKKLGWRSDLALDELIEKTQLKINGKYQIKKPDLWKIILAENHIY